MPVTGSAKPHILGVSYEPGGSSKSYLEIKGLHPMPPIDPMPAWDEEESSTQTTQEMPALAYTYTPGDTWPDLSQSIINEAIERAIRAEQQQRCVICQWVREIQTGFYSPGIYPEYLCDEHQHAMAALGAGGQGLGHAIMHCARHWNIWPGHKSGD